MALKAALQNGNAGMALQKQDNDEMLSQISTTDTPVGGSLCVLIPTDEFLAGPKGHLNTLQLNKNQFMAVIEAVRRRGLFETMELRQSINPEQEAFETDFALVRPAKKKTEWLLRVQTQAGHDVVPIASAPTSLSRFQQIMIWLSNIEEAATKTKQQLGKVR